MNKKVLPAIILIVAIMIIGFCIQYFSIKDSGEEIQSAEQITNYTDAVEKCQVAKENQANISDECKKILDEK